MRDTLKSVEAWHKAARPVISDEAFSVQLGCHLEEIVEMLESVNIECYKYTASHARFLLGMMSDFLKSGEATATITSREEFLDAIADQVVTGIGAAYCAGMNAPEAIGRVDDSNWSKFVEGKPLFNGNKIAKGPHYRKPDLTGLY